MNVFQIAAQKKYRFQTTQGNLSTEDLFDLPLTSQAFAKVDLNKLAMSVNKALKEIDEESFVDVRPNPAKSELETKLEILKAVIAIKQAEAKAAADRKAKADKLSTLYAALQDAEKRELATATKEDLQKQISELTGAL